MRNKQIAAALFAVLLFAGGVTVGVLGDRYYSMKVVHARPAADVLRQHYVDEMRSRLRLSDDQLTRLNVVLDQTHARFKAFREEHKQEFDHIGQEQTNAVRALLTAQQLPEFEKMVAEREHHRKQHDR
jgi:hypothetical protein